MVDLSVADGLEVCGSGLETQLPRALSWVYTQAAAQMKSLLWRLSSPGREGAGSSGSGGWRGGFEAVHQVSMQTGRKIAVACG
jgi:hypothetical protein